MCNGIGEMKQNIDEMAKKTDAICIWVFGDVHGMIAAWIIETTKNVGVMAKKTDAICISVLGEVQGMIAAWDR
jgi:hypothetical protein